MGEENLAASEVADTSATSQPAEANGAGAAAPQITDLDGLSSWKYQGKEYNPDAWSKIMSEHQSYSGQAKEYEKAQEFRRNLELDIDSVTQDPRLADRFKQVYPREYHFLVDKLLGRSPQNAGSSAQGSALPKEFEREFNQMRGQVGQFQQYLQKAQMDAANAKMDAILPKLYSKYPLSTEVEVMTKAEAMLARGQQITDAAWERMVRESHEAQQKKSDQFHAAKMKSQIDKGKRGADAPAGGSVPGQKPVKPRTFDEAREAMMAALRK